MQKRIESCRNIKTIDDEMSIQSRKLPQGLAQSMIRFIRVKSGEYMKFRNAGSRNWSRREFRMQYTVYQLRVRPLINHPDNGL